MNEIAQQAALSRIGRNIKIGRARTGDTQESLARKAGLNTTQLARMERGEVQFSVIKLLQVAHGLGLPIEDFFEGVEDA